LNAGDSGQILNCDVSSISSIFADMAAAHTDSKVRTDSGAAQSTLDGMVVNLELTLISIIQGVALYFLTDSSRALLLSLQLSAWPYILAGLLVILLWWSRAVIHTLTVIRWPIEFGHNFLYIASTLVEAVMFTQVGNPANWYWVGATYGLLVWLLFTIDLRLIGRRMKEPLGPAGARLLAIIHREQRLQALLFMPVTVLFYLAARLFIHSNPQFFIEANGHLIFAALQLAGALTYIAYIVLYFRRLSGLILASRAEK
jgi:hypothetical protein